MRKRIFSMILALAMIVCLLPAAAFNVVAEDSSVKTYVKVTEKPDDWSGTYIIVCKDTNSIFNGVTDAASNVVSISNIGATIVGDYSSCEIVVAPFGDGYSLCNSNNKYISGQSGSNKMLFSNAVVAYFEFNSEDEIHITSNTSVFRCNPNGGKTWFRFFKSTTYTSQKAVQLYKLQEDNGGDEPDPDEPDPDDCKHEWDEGLVTQEPTCTEKGTKVCTCELCGEEKEFDIDPLGHDLEYYETVDPTCAENGYDLYICLREGCDYSEHRNETPKGAHNFTKGVCEVCGTKIYVQVTSNGELEGTGTYLIVCKAKNMIAAEHNSSNYYNNEGITFTGSAIVGEYSAHEFTIIDCGGDGYTISRNGQYMYHSGNNNAYESDTVKYNTIAFDANGNAIIGNDNYVLKYNASSPRFSYYKSGQTDIQIYKIHDEHSYDENSTCTVCGHQNGVLAGGDLGDINGDDVVDIVDAQLLADYLADNLDEDAIDADWFECFDIVADLDENGKISVYDLSLMLAYLYE